MNPFPAATSNIENTDGKPISASKIHQLFEMMSPIYSATVIDLFGLPVTFHEFP
jgi:hypothetical protein